MSRVRIQFTLFSAFYSPLIMTMAGGFLQRQGLEFDWSVSPPGKPATESVTDGSADVVQSAPSQAFNAIIRGETEYPRHFAQVNEMDGFFITGREADPGFDWRRLEGAEMVIFGGGQPNAMLRYACHRAGIDFDSIEAITPGGAADIDRAFRDGQGQYVQQQGPYPQQLEADGVGRIVAQVGPLIGPCAFSSLAASREWLQTDEAIAFTRAYAEARRYLNEAPAEEVTARLKSYFADTDPTALQTCIAAYQQLGCWTPHVEITREALEKTLNIFEYTGGISERYPYEAVCALPPGYSEA
jgi:NitT/TauT family transport system substrate-binding protein